MNVHRIPTKLGTEVHLNASFKYTKFQLDRSTRLHFMVDFVKCEKRRNKMKWLELFSSNLDCGLPNLTDTSVANLVSIG